jgi:uncharacterized protein
VTAALIVIAKAPAPGRSKTRLSPPLSLKGAAQLAEAALQDTLLAAAACPVARRVLALDGEPRPRVPEGFATVPQRGDGLDERLAAAFEDVGGPALLIGMDTPQIGSAELSDALECLDRPGVDAVLGPALDGGYWAIGLKRPRPELLLGVPMSSPRTFEAQLSRLRSQGLEVVALRPTRDVDLIEDARAVARLAPGSRFASALRACAA